MVVTSTEPSLAPQFALPELAVITIATGCVGVTGAITIHAASKASAIVTEYVVPSPHKSAVVVAVLSALTLSQIYV